MLSFYNEWPFSSGVVVVNVVVRGLAFSSEGGSQIYKKSATIKLHPPPFRQQKFYDPHHQYTLTPKQATIVLKSVFFEQNKHTTCGHLVTPYILVIKNFMTPLFFLTPPVYLGPPSEENASPLS